MQRTHMDTARPARRRARALLAPLAAVMALGVGIPGAAAADEARVSPAVAAAPDTGRAITVGGAGEAKSKPNLLEIDARITGSGELVNDTLTKYRETRRRALEAIKAL